MSCNKNQGERTQVRTLTMCEPVEAVSFIRTVTVGTGITPVLLTRTPARACIRRSRAPEIAHSYRRWGISPRPENATSIKPV